MQQPGADSDGRERTVMVVALVLPTAITVVYFILLAGFPAGIQQAAYLLGKAVQFALPVAWVYSCERRLPRPARPVPGELWFGGCLGAAILASMALLYVFWLKPHALPPEAIEAIRAKVAGIGVGQPLAFALLGLFYSLFHSLLEEYYWRWFVYGRLRRLAPMRWALVTSALGFMAHHVCVLAQFFGWTSGLTLFFSAAVALGGLLWGIAFERYRSLYGVWLSHLLVDAGIFAIGYDLALS